MSPRLTAELFVAATIRRAETEGATAHIGRRGADGAGAVLIKLIATGAGFGRPAATALERVTLGADGSGWIWIVGPEPDYEAEVDAKLAKRADFDPDLWILEIEDRNGARFLDDPIV